MITHIGINSEQEKEGVDDFSLTLETRDQKPEFHQRPL